MGRRGCNETSSSITISRIINLQNVDEIRSLRMDRSNRVLTDTLQQLRVAVVGEERRLQASKVKLQHTGHRVQVALTVRQRILSCGQFNTHVVAAHT